MHTSDITKRMAKDEVRRTTTLPKMARCDPPDQSQEGDRAAFKTYLQKATAYYLGHNQADEFRSSMEPWGRYSLEADLEKYPGALWIFLGRPVYVVCFHDHYSVAYGATEEL